MVMYEISVEYRIWVRWGNDNVHNSGVGLRTYRYPACGGGEWTFEPNFTPTRLECSYRPNLLWNTSPSVIVMALRISRVMYRMTRSPQAMVAREWNAEWGSWVMVEVVWGATTAVIVSASGYLRGF